jgi:hypothetical protein
MTMKNQIILITAGCLCMTLAACSGRQGATGSGATETLTADQTKAKSQMAAQMQAAKQTAQTYHAMDTPTLLNKLADQSVAQQEPFNSLAFRELKTRTDVDSKAMVALVNQHKDASGLLPLLLLRRLDNKTYLTVPVEERAGILTGALKSSKYFNTWGIPNFNLEEASNALIETGRTAEPALKEMLRDTRPAPVFGSQEYMIYKQYQFRVCDYALMFLKRIDGDNAFRLPVTVAERDAIVKQVGTK